MVKKWNAGDIEGGCRAPPTKGPDGEFNGWRICSRPAGPGTPCIVQAGLIKAARAMLRSTVSDNLALRSQVSALPAWYEGVRKSYGAR